ncbi:unnamed protein product [Mortierella alpina]
MIHAYLFVTKAIQDHDGHGPDFQYHMNRINAAAQTTISIYHTFHDEVAHYQTHVWKCDGPCQHRPPYFGLVKRSMNRPPQPADRWFAEHQSTCGGNYTKISEPEPTPKKSRTAKNVKSKDSAPRARTLLDDFLSGSKSAGPSSSASTSNGFNNPEPHNNSKGINHSLTDFKAETTGDNKDANLAANERASSQMLLALKKESSPEKDWPAAKEAAAAAALARFDRHLKQQDPTSSPALDNIALTVMKRRGLDSTSTSGAGINPESWKRAKTEDGISTDTRAKDTSCEIDKDRQANALNDSAVKLESENKLQTQASVLTGTLVQCPVCFKQVEEATINDHVDLCIWWTSGGN